MINVCRRALDVQKGYTAQSFTNKAYNGIQNNKKRFWAIYGKANHKLNAKKHIGCILKPITLNQYEIIKDGKSLKVINFDIIKEHFFQNSNMTFKTTWKKKSLS